MEWQERKKLSIKANGWYLLCALAQGAIQGNLAPPVASWLSRLDCLCECSIQTLYYKGGNFHVKHFAPTQTPKRINKSMQLSIEEKPKWSGGFEGSCLKCRYVTVFYFLRSNSALIYSWKHSCKVTGSGSNTLEHAWDTSAVAWSGTSREMGHFRGHIFTMASASVKLKD